MIKVFVGDAACGDFMAKGFQDLVEGLGVAVGVVVQDGCFEEHARAKLELAAVFHGFEHGDFVGEFDVGADGDAHSDAGAAEAQGFEEPGEVGGGGFAFYGGVGGEDDFGDVATS